MLSCDLTCSFASCSLYLTTYKFPPFPPISSFTLHISLMCPLKTSLQFHFLNKTFKFEYHTSFIIMCYAISFHGNPSSTTKQHNLYLTSSLLSSTGIKTCIEGGPSKSPRNLTVDFPQQTQSSLLNGPSKRIYWSKEYPLTPTTTKTKP